MKSNKKVKRVVLMMFPGVLFDTQRLQNCGL